MPIRNWSSFHRGSKCRPAGASRGARRTPFWWPTGAIHEPFAVINADDFYGAEGYGVLARHLQSGSADYAMVGFVLRNTLSDFGSVARGVCQVSGDGFLQDVVEMTKIERDGAQARNTDAAGRVTKLTGDEAVSMNMWGFTPRVFGHLQEYFERFLELSGPDAKSECFIPSAVNELVLTGQARVKVLPTNDSWFGITYREDHPRVAASIGRHARVVLAMPTHKS